MMPLMCDLWDRNEFSYATKNRGSINATNICVSLIGGCVPDYIRKLNRDALSPVIGGFTSRCIFVYSTERSQIIVWPNINGQFSRLEHELVNDLQDMSIQTGEFIFDQKAILLWEAECKSVGKIADQFESDVLMGFKSRMKSHIFKTAMALSMSDSNNKIITERHLWLAMDLVKGVKDKVDLTFRSLGESPLAAQQDRVLRFIQYRQSCTAEDIFSRMSQHMTYQQFEQILYVLKMAGKIRKLSVGKVEMWQII
jgi:hypothetical protein